MHSTSLQPHSGLRPGDVVLFQGDSITNAFRRPDEVSNAYQLGAGYPLILAAHLLQTRPADALQFHNRGVAGNTLGQVRARWQADALALDPTVISLLVGINDTAYEAGGNTVLSAAQFEQEYRALLQESRRALPDVRFILCQPFALTVGLVTERWLAPLAQRQRVVASLAREFEAVFVPLQPDFDAATRQAPPAYWIYDGVHPTAPGHQLIAQAWLRAVAPRGSASAGKPTNRDDLAYVVS